MSVFKKNATSKDVYSSISLFLISLPITAGIAVASKVSPEAGLFSAIFGAMVLGFFSSSELLVYGPAAGLSVFISAANLRWGEYGDVSAAISLTGFFLCIVGLTPFHNIIHLFPSSVMKGMASGIGLILILKMIPHLFGYDAIYLTNDAFLQSDGRNTLTEIIFAIQNASMGPVIVSAFTIIMVGFWSKRRNLSSRLPFIALVVVVASCLAHYLSLVNSDWTFNSYQMLHIESLQFKLKPFWSSQIHWYGSIKLAIILTSVIILEGLATIEVVKTMDSKHQINPKREIFLMGLGNIFMGFCSALPLMPVLIRSTANSNFGATSRWSVIFHGILLLGALIFYQIFSYIPMAAVAAILVTVGMDLLNIPRCKAMYAKGKNHFIPFLATVICMVVMDFLLGLLAGFIIGMIFAMRGSLKRTMVLVNDGDRYLLRFFKDVTFVHKIELIKTLSKVPEGKEVLINGTGNVFVDADIEEWLETYQQECLSRNCKLTFIKSNLSVSRLFKES